MNIHIKQCTSCKYVKLKNDTLKSCKMQNHQCSKTGNDMHWKTSYMPQSENKEPYQYHCQNHLYPNRVNQQPPPPYLTYVWPLCALGACLEGVESRGEAGL